MTAGLVADPGVDRCGDVWLGEDFGSDSVLSCGVCIGCESDIVLDEEASVDFVRLLDLYLSAGDQVSIVRSNQALHRLSWT